MTYHFPSEDYQPQLESIGDLVFSPETDIPFGKNIRIGLKEYTIYESVIEEGYEAGIIAHRAFLKDNQRKLPAALDDTQFTMIMQNLIPQDLPLSEKQLWRSFFIAGWTCILLGLAPCEDDEE